MTVLGILLAIIVGLVALLVLLPFHVLARGAVREGTPSGEARIVWAFGALGVIASPGEGVLLQLFGIRVWRVHRRRTSEHEEKKRQEGKREKRRAKEERPGRGRELVRHRHALLQMALRAIRALRLRLRVAGTVGLDDPANTAALVAAVRVLERTPGLDLQLGWNWLEDELEVEAEGSARVWLAQLVGVFVMLLFRAENRAAIWALR